jgi:multicomponent Na+:H+ antiporter subunit D
MIEWVHPGLLLILGAVLIPFLSGRVRQIYLVAVPVLVLADILMMTPGKYGVVPFLDYQLTLGKVDRLSLVFGYVFSTMAVIGMVYSLHVKRWGQHAAAWIYVGGALGVVFSGDLVSLFLFWELMGASVFLIWFAGGEAAIWSGFRYLMVHMFGGMCLLGGIVLYVIQTGSIEFGLIPSGGLAGSLILLGFLVNAAVPPLHAWLKDAYPEATVTGAVFLSAFTTKTAVYVLIRAFPGTEILVWLGAVMAIYGVVYAVLENDMRRLLAYHIISQVGYMVCGVGMGTELALNGASAHAFAHILYKGLLFMGAGAVIEMTGKRKLTELGGLYKTMPLTLTLYMIGGFSISAFPLFSGFVTKSMVIAAAGEDHRAAIWLMLTLASAGTFLHTGLKLPYYTFFGKDSGIRAKEPPVNMLIGMGLAAFLCVFIGMYPKILYDVLPYTAAFVPYTASHVVQTLQILLFTALGFFLLLKQLDPEPMISLDTDWFYRMGGRGLLWLARHPIAYADAVLGEAYSTVILNPCKRLGGLLGVFDARVVDGTVNEIGMMTQRGASISTWIEKYVIYGLLNVIGYSNHLFSRILRKIQSGLVHHYAAIIIGGIILLVNIFLWWSGRVSILDFILFR